MQSCAIKKSELILHAVSSNPHSHPIPIMNVLLIVPILHTAEHGIIPRRETIHDCIAATFARGFIARGHTVTLVAAQEFKPTSSETHAFDVVYFPSALKAVFKPHLLPWLKGFKSWLKQNAHRFDMIVSSEAFSLATLTAARVAPEKVVVWQEMAFHQHKFFTLASRLWHHIFVKREIGKCLIVPRSEAARLFISQFSTNVSTSIVDHGADCEVFKPIDDDDEVQDAFVVLSMLAPRKQIDKIVNAFALLVKTDGYRHYRLHIIGDGPCAQELAAQAKQLGVENNVIFHGRLKHTSAAKIVARAKAMLIATSKDLNMVTIPEAIAAGTPIVTNSVPLSAAYIREKQLGIMQDNWDERTLIQAINKYPHYHACCLKHGTTLTNVACARKMVDIFLARSRQRPNLQASN